MKWRTQESGCGRSRVGHKMSLKKNCQPASLNTSGVGCQDLFYNYGLVGANIDSTWLRNDIVGRTYICSVKRATSIPQLDDKGTIIQQHFFFVFCFFPPSTRLCYVICLIQQLRSMLYNMEIWKQTICHFNHY